MKIVLDTNVLVSGLLHSQGNSGQIVTLALADAVQTCHNKLILAEYADVLARPRERAEHLGQRRAARNLFEDDVARLEDTARAVHRPCGERREIHDHGRVMQ